MRAMFNPSRMKVIEKATLKLVKKIKSDDDSIEIRMKKNFKIIDRIKSYSKNKNIVFAAD